MFYDQEGQRQRRDLWYQTTREHVREWVNADGSGILPQFDPPYREPIWILPALYTGSQEYIDLANAMVANVFASGKVNLDSTREQSGRDFGIFQSNALAHSLHRFGDLLTPAAREVMEYHTRMVFRTYQGSAQSDFKFHGANDNMPMLATKGLIFGGEALGDEAAFRQGVWNLNQFRRLLSRGAWASEFNSSTYLAVTLSASATMATWSHDPEVRALATEIEHRLWAEVLLHYHPGTLRQAGPQSRAYSIDFVGHNHALQLLLWTAFGPEIVGRDMIGSYFHPDGTEVIHFEGNYAQSVAEFCDMLDADLHLPENLAPLATSRQYPAVLRGRTEAMGRFDGQAGPYHTETYMEESFSLGTVDAPMGGGEQTVQLYATYKLRPEVKSFRDAATIFPRYFTADEEQGVRDASSDGVHSGERHISSRGWCYAMQKANTGLLLCTPNLVNAPPQTDTLKLALIFPAHYGRITRSIMGAGPAVAGAVGESAEVVPVSVEAGEVYVNVVPLLPTNLPRRAALRWRTLNQYEMLELVNYEGPEREFTRAQAAMVLNGLVMTVAARADWESLEAFHAALSAPVITDYLLSNHRFLLYQRPDVEFEVVMTTDPVGVQTEAIDGRTVERPIFYSNQLDPASLPFVTGPVARNFPLFPWGESLEAWPYHDNRWLIGSRGLPEEPNYSHRVSDDKD
ncbi:MAG TPA: hypothetical protein VGM19_14860 [Armatimonadota bacterium]|jgi:hypothetical protein